MALRSGDRALAALCCCSECPASRAVTFIAVSAYTKATLEKGLRKGRRNEDEVKRDVAANVMVGVASSVIWSGQTVEGGMRANADRCTSTVIDFWCVR